MKTEVRYFMNQPSGQLQGFLLFEKWAKVWDDYLKGLNLSGRGMQTKMNLMLSKKNTQKS